MSGMPWSHFALDVKSSHSVICGLNMETLGNQPDVLAGILTDLVQYVSIRISFNTMTSNI